jgi:probable HAF family extracellular repeat protein
MRSSAVRLAAACTALATFAVVAPLAGQQTFIDIGLLGPAFSTLWAVNNHDEAVGWSETHGLDSEHAILWKDGALVDLGVLPGDNASRALGINGQGDIVGLSADTTNFQARAVAWTNGQIIDLGFPGCIATAVNNRGDVLLGCGALLSLRRGDVMVSIAPLPGYTGVRASAINDAGVVVGAMVTSTGRSDAFRWENGQATVLSPSVDGRPSSATAINARGQIVLNVTTFPGAGGIEPALWDRGTAVPLAGEWGRFSAQAWGINARGEVVGSGADLVTLRGGAFVWSNGIFRFLTPSNGVALDINDRGVAVGRHFVEEDASEHGILWLKPATRVPLRLPRDTTVP